MTTYTITPCNTYTNVEVDWRCDIDWADDTGRARWRTVRWGHGDKLVDSGGHVIEGELPFSVAAEVFLFFKAQHYAPEDRGKLPPFKVDVP